VADGELARQHRCTEHIRARWPAFLAARQAHLGSHGTGQTPPEKIAENILCDLFTRVLDWATEQVRLQENYVDLLLTRLGVKYLIVETKRPGSFDGPVSIGRALEQARRYAEVLNVDKIAVSDGCILEAHDLTRAHDAAGSSSLRPRLRVHLADVMPPDDLWWLSTRGIYRTPPAAPAGNPPEIPCDEGLLHPKYQLPARCFAFVGHPDRPATWKLPYLHLDGTVDDRRLPKAIQSVLRDYRGEQVRLPEDLVPEVLGRLAEAACRQGRMPDQDATPAAIYQALRNALVQMGRPEHVAGFSAACPDQVRSVPSSS
jgi:hypothetical protein